MKNTLLLIHGKRAYLCSEEDDKKFIVNKTPQLDGKFCEGLNYIIEGSVIVRDNDSGDIVGKYKAGEIFSTVSSDVSLQLYFIGDTKWLCLTEQTEANITVTHIVEETTLTIPNKTDLVLVNGMVQTNGKTFAAVTPLRVRSGDVVLKATQEATLIIYK